MKNKNNLAYLILILTTIFWSGNFIVGKFASFYEVPPFSLNFYRWFFAWLILAPFTLPELFKKNINYGSLNVFKSAFNEFNTLKSSNQVTELDLEGINRSMRVAIASDEEQMNVNLSFLASLLKTISRVGLFKPYSNHLKKTVTTATHTMF